MYELEPYLVDIPPNTRSLPFLSSCMITCELPTSPIFSLIILFGLWVLTDLSLNLINFKIVIFASCVCCINLILDHIWPTPSLGMKYTSVVKSTNRTMTVAILVIRNLRRCVLAMMKFLMHIMTLSHFQQISSGSHS